MNPYQYVRRTSGNAYPLEIGYQLVNLKDIPIDRERTTAACREGCGQYGRSGGCPPFAPDFSQIRGRYNYGALVYSKLYTRDYPPKVLNPKRSPYYVRWSLVETVMSPVMTAIGERWKVATGWMFLNTGHCQVCKKCALKAGAKECARPSHRTFSMEATGILVTDTIRDQLGFEIQWWDKHDANYIPEYMTKVILLLSLAEIDEERIRGVLPINEESREIKLF